LRLRPAYTILKIHAGSIFHLTINSPGLMPFISSGKVGLFPRFEVLVSKPYCRDWVLLQKQSFAAPTCLSLMDLPVLQLDKNNRQPQRPGTGEPHYELLNREQRLNSVKRSIYTHTGNALRIM
jgi:hypothetical protein